MIEETLVDGMILGPDRDRAEEYGSTYWDTVPLVIKRCSDGKWNWHRVDMQGRIRFPDEHDVASTEVLRSAMTVVAIPLSANPSPHVECPECGEEFILGSDYICQKCRSLCGVV